MRVPPARAPLAGGKVPPRIHCSNNEDGGAALILIATWLAVAVVLAIVLAACAVPLR